MARDLKKEAEWERKKYKRYQYRCPKETAEKFDKKMSDRGICFSQLVRNSIKVFLEEE